MLDIDLRQYGFTLNPDVREEMLDRARRDGLNNGGQFDLMEVWTRGETTLWVEKNSDTQHVSGIDVHTDHPPVAIVDGPNGRFACNPADIQLLMRLIETSQ